MIIEVGGGKQEFSLFIKVKFDMTIKSPSVKLSRYLDIPIVDWLGQ